MKIGGNAQDFSHEVQRIQKLVHQVLTSSLPFSQGMEVPLVEAMCYATLNGGKRLRPFLVWATGQLFQVPEALLIKIGAAVELVHCYSLVHDDLPVMDNSDLRRGQPTCHKQFDEATALLAGSALLTAAFELLSAPDLALSSDKKLQLIRLLTVATGARGMIAGQMQDLIGESRTLSLAETIEMCQLKTGALIEVSCLMAATAGGAGPEELQALKDYGQKLGLLYQMVDDLLDSEGDISLLGKTPGLDTENNKSTFVALLGADALRGQIQKLLEDIKADLAPFGEKAAYLSEFATYAAARKA